MEAYSRGGGLFGGRRLIRGVEAYSGGGGLFEGCSSKTYSIFLSLTLNYSFAVEHLHLSSLSTINICCVWLSVSPVYNFGFSGKVEQEIKLFLLLFVFR